MDLDQALSRSGVTPPETAGDDPSARAEMLGPFQIDSLQDDPELRALADFAARLCDAPIASVTVVEDTKQRFIAWHGVEERETPRSVSFCSHAMQGRDVMIVRDAPADPRFADNSLVTGEMGLRFYAGAPLVTAEGLEIGALCVIDQTARPEGLTPMQEEGLRVLASAAVRRLTAEREAARVREGAKRGARMMSLVLDSVPGIAWSANERLEFDYFNARWTEVTGAPAPTTVDDWRAHIHPEDFPNSLAKFKQAVEDQRVFSDELRMRLSDGTYRWALSRAVPIDVGEGSWRWVGTIIDIDDAHRLSQSRDLLARELSHRIKNIFAVISSLIALSARPDPTLRGFAAEMTDKISALGRAHEFVSPTSAQEPTNLLGLLEQLFAPYNAGGASRITVAGSDADLSSRAATPLALVFHELATNSAKYGLLSREDGNVTVQVDIPDGSGNLEITWNESGVARPDDAPDGFGSRLLKMSIEGQLHGSIDQDWSDDGLRVVLTVPLASISG